MCWICNSVTRRIYNVTEDKKAQCGNLYHYLPGLSKTGWEREKRNKKETLSSSLIEEIS